MSRGTFSVSRAIWDHPDFEPSQFSQREAFLWLVSEASWKPRRVRAGRVVADLERGQLCASTRYMAETWGWSKSKVDRFLRKLERLEMLRVRNGTAHRVITLCNYDKFQPSHLRSGTVAGQSAGQQPGQQRDSNRDSERDSNETVRMPASYCDETGKQDGETGDDGAAGQSAGQQRDSREAASGTVSGTNTNKDYTGNKDSLGAVWAGGLAPPQGTERETHLPENLDEPVGRQRGMQERQLFPPVSHHPEGQDGHSQASTVPPSGIRDGNSADTAPDGEKPPRKRRGTQLPGDWTLPDDWLTWALDEGYPREAIMREADVFRDYWCGERQGATKVDWKATWRNWMRRSRAKRNAEPSRQSWQQAFMAGGLPGVDQGTDPDVAPSLFHGRHGSGSGEEGGG